MSIRTKNNISVIVGFTLAIIMLPLWLVMMLNYYIFATVQWLNIKFVWKEKEKFLTFNEFLFFFEH